MNLIIESSGTFEKSFRRFSKKEQTKIIEKIEYYGDLFVRNRSEFFKNAHQPVFFKLNDAFDSSLYYFKIKQNVQIIASFDEDPIFDSVIITLLKIFRHKDIEKNFKSVAESLYQQFLNVKRI